MATDNHTTASANGAATAAPAAQPTRSKPSKKRAKKSKRGRKGAAKPEAKAAAPELSSSGFPLSATGGYDRKTMRGLSGYAAAVNRAAERAAAWTKPIRQTPAGKHAVERVVEAMHIAWYSLAEMMVYGDEFGSGHYAPMPVLTGHYVLVFRCPFGGFMSLAFGNPDAEPEYHDVVPDPDGSLVVH